MAQKSLKRKQVNLITEENKKEAEKDIHLTDDTDTEVFYIMLYETF